MYVNSSRFDIPSQPQHIIQRGNNRSIIFAGEEDYQFYLKKLGDVCQKFQCDLHAYVLMTNHVHLLITPHLKGGIGISYQDINGVRLDRSVFVAF
ncbi:transposase [Nitrosomonas sp.]|uniref:transposase n=1 Tax=Nitrosomonas sp. TaxID=42353 RepID=UPI00283AA6DA|nr:transposase [Nitrosomonas sp.]